MMNNILVPFDFSDIARNALDFASQLASQIGNSQLTILNVVEHPTPSSFKTMGVNDYDPMENLYLTRLIESVKTRLEELLENETLANVSASYKIKIGNPYHEISAEITATETDLVVMGTSGATGTDEFLLGLMLSGW